MLDHLTDGSPVLDCGIGTGAFSLALVDALTVKPNVCGVDLSPEMVREAGRLLDSRGVRGQVRCGDVRKLPFAENTFDLVISAHMLDHLPDPAAGLREMVRVLRPGAPLLLSVTRSGLPAALLQLRWRNGGFHPETMAEILADVGLVSSCACPYPVGLSRWTSMAYLGYKQ